MFYMDYEKDWEKEIKKAEGHFTSILLFLEELADLNANWLEDLNRESWDIGDSPEELITTLFDRSAELLDYHVRIRQAMKTLESIQNDIEKIVLNLAGQSPDESRMETRSKLRSTWIIIPTMLIMIATIKRTIKGMSSPSRTN